MSDASMGYYPIRAVAEKTGVHPVTLRAWERRYGLIQPMRTPKGHRLYSENDIELIRKVVALLETGVPISQVKGALERFTSAPAPDSYSHDGSEQQARELAEAALSLQPGALDAVYQKSLRSYPTLLLIRRVLRPAVERLSRLEGREPLAPHARSLLCCYLASQIGHHLWQQSLHNRGVKLLLSALSGDESDIEAMLIGLYLVDRGFRLLWLPQAAPLRYLGESAVAGKSVAILLYAGTTPPQHVLAQELPVLVASVDLPVYAIGAAAAQQAGAFRAARVEPLPLDEEAMLERIQEQIRGH